MVCMRAHKPHAGSDAALCCGCRTCASACAISALAMRREALTRACGCMCLCSSSKQPLLAGEKQRIDRCLSAQGTRKQAHINNDRCLSAQGTRKQAQINNEDAGSRGCSYGERRVKGMPQSRGEQICAWRADELAS